MSQLRKDYDAWWREHPYQGEGPANWRQDYHGEPCVEMGALCDEAEAKGMRVGVEAGARRLGGVNRRYRLIMAVTVAKPGKSPSIRVLLPVGGTLPDACRAARRGLAKL